MASLQLRSRLAWSAPFALVLPFLMGADGNGCQPGGPITIGSGEEGGVAAEGGSGVDAGLVCAPASCAGLAAPALAKLCPDGTAVTANVCEAIDGHCDWGFPACPTDACVALPCDPCAYGSTGVGMDANGCATCPICAPAPDAGSCQCGAPPPVAACPGGGSRSVTCEPASTGSCSWVIGSCPSPSNDAGRTADACPASAPICNLPNCMYGVIPRTDANGCDVCPVCAPPPDGGSVACGNDSDCPSAEVCGFLETNACGAAGSCFPAPMVICNAYSPGCACDGSEVDIICNGLPSGYVRKPLKHTGACVDGG